MLWLFEIALTFRGRSFVQLRKEFYKMYFLLKMVIFHCYIGGYISLPEGRPKLRPHNLSSNLTSTRRTSTVSWLFPGPPNKRKSRWGFCTGRQQHEISCKKRRSLPQTARQKKIWHCSARKTAWNRGSIFGMTLQPPTSKWSIQRLRRPGRRLRPKGHS